MGNIIIIIAFLPTMDVFLYYKNFKEKNMSNETNKYNSKKNIEKERKNNNKNLKWIIIIAIFLAMTLSFHYVPSHGMIFPKNSLTFSYTIITQDDIDNILERYNNANFWEKQAINNEPIMRKLMEKGIIVESKDKK